MLTVLFSPSEGKRPGGLPEPVSDGSLLFGLGPRRRILDAYNGIVLSDDTAAVLELFGLKKPEDAAAYRHDIHTAPTMPAVERYDGVAYDYLDLPSLDADARRWLEGHLLIFSNLFGVLRAGDRIPAYKVKQGNTVGGIAPDLYYREAFARRLDTLLEEREVLDLRAGYYDRFYKPAAPFVTMKFVKGGRVVSHWAKAYRGIVLRTLAQHGIETVEALLATEIPGLHVREILETKRKREIVYDIVT